jgi:hypothetical protein
MSLSGAFNQNKGNNMKTISSIRHQFWADNPQFKGAYRKTYRQNRYNATIRSAFVEYVNYLECNGEISESLANRATL